MLRKPINYTTAWEQVGATLKTIFNLVAGGDAPKVSGEGFIKIYTLIHTWSNAKEDEPRMQLYFNISTLLDEEVNKSFAQLSGKNERELLDSFQSLLARYSTATTSVAGLFVSLDRSFISAKRIDGLQFISDLSVMKWREICYTPLQPELIKILLHLINARRDGIHKEGDDGLLQGAINVYLKLGVPKDNLDFYEKEFNAPYLAGTKEYYTKETKDSIASTGRIFDYSAKMLERLETELKFLEQFSLPEMTKPELLAILEDAWITTYYETHWEPEFVKMLKTNNQPEISKFYTLVFKHPFPGSMKCVLATMKQWVVDSGVEIVSDFAPKLKRRNQLKESPPLVNQLLQFHQRVTEVIENCTQNATEFKQVLDEGFSVFVNKPAGVFLMPEVFDNYVNDIMLGKDRQLLTSSGSSTTPVTSPQPSRAAHQPGGATPPEPEEISTEITSHFDAVVRLITYHNDKDIFYTFFRNSLGKRLLGGHAKENWEMSFVELLKIACGDIYTEKLVGMFEDLKESKEHYVPKFKEFCTEKGDSKSSHILNAKVLNDSYWITTNPKSKTNLTLTPEFAPSMAAFEEFYKTQEEKKMITWVFHLGDTLVDYAFIAEQGGSKQHVLLGMSVLQSCVCLLFNQQKQWRFQDIADRLSVDADQLRLAISPLLFTKEHVLENMGPDGKGKPRAADGTVSITWETAMLDDDLLTLFAPQTTKRRIRYTPSMQLPHSTAQRAATTTTTTSETTKTSTTTTTTIGVEDIQADPDEEVAGSELHERAIRFQMHALRVIKSKRAISQDDLLKEVAVDLEKHFSVAKNTRFVKAQIDLLIDRGFLSRDTDEAHLLHYVG